MLTTYVVNNGTMVAHPLDDGLICPDNAVWLDLCNPTEAEESAVERLLGLDIPTRAEMQDIEVSSRLYQENGALYMTATLLTKADTDQPETTAATFVLAKGRLVTIRYADPVPFRAFVTQAAKMSIDCSTGENVLVGLLESIIERIAEVLERVQHDSETLSRETFAKGATDFDPVLRKIGRLHALTSQANESLVSLSRLSLFVGRLIKTGETKPSKALTLGLKTLSRDVRSLSEHAAYLSANVTFLLDATLGMINNRQNGIIKIFSVVAVIFLPPTLIASIYGMNFKFMPELDWALGYPFAILLMVAAAIVPYLYFKARGWL